MRRTLEFSAVIASAILIAMAFHAWLASHDEQLRMQGTIATQKQQLDAADARERARATALDQTLAQIQKLKRDTQTPEEILKQLPQYLNLPQPITLSPPATGDDSHATGTSPADQKKNQKGTGLRLFGRNWFARKATPSGGDERASPSARNSSAGATSNFNLDAAPPEGVGSDRSGTPSQAIPFSVASQTATVERPENPSKSSSPSYTKAELPDAANQSRDPSSSKRTASETNPTASDPASVQIPAADLKPLYDYVQDCRSCQAQLAAAEQNRADDAAKLTAMAHERDAAVVAAKGGTLWRRFRRNLEWFAIGAASAATTAAAISAANSTTCHPGHCR